MFDLDTLIWLVPALPLAAALVTAVAGPRLLRERSHWPTLLGLAAAFIFSLAQLFLVYHAARDEQARAIEAQRQVSGYEHLRTIYRWALVDKAWAEERGDGTKFSPFVLDVTLRADPLTAAMLVMVTFVSLLVAIYSVGYMHGDPGYWRFFAYISLFVFSMTMLVSVSNFLLLYIFWEAVGVCSYLLIGFWYEKPEAATAGKKAFLVNRIGDFAFALGVFLIWAEFNTLSFHNEITPNGMPVLGVLSEDGLSQQLVNPGTLTLICLLLFAGACGKSAQFPLHVWLPDAMEGPSPVGALIHAATMVTAGVYLLARCAPLFVVSQLHWAGYVVAAVGGFTALLAALIALTQTDLKRILAYSTISQLGYMFLGLGTMTIAGITAAMFHLMTHAFFKAILFLGAGSVMHAMGNVIDIRQFGGLRKRLPVTHFTFLIGSLALAGFPILTGFWSKDAILGAVHDKADGGIAAFKYVYGLLWVVGLVTAALTAFYTFRAYFRTFYGAEKIPPEAGHHAHESPQVMTAPLGMLAGFTLLASALFLVYPKSHLQIFPEFLARTPSLQYVSQGAALEQHFHWDVAILGGLAALAGIGAAAVFYLGRGALLNMSTALARRAYVYQLSQRKFYLDEVYYLLFVWPLKIVAFIFRFFDNLFIDGLVNLGGWLPRAAGAVLRPLGIGLVQFYALAMMLGLIVLIGSLLWWG